MLAIIIPFYKLTFFEETIQSLAIQTDKRFKVYIGDDASPDDCSSLLEQFRGKFDFVYHRFESNLGGISLTQQWDRCIALSKGEEWIMVLGDDDVLGDTVVESFYKNEPIFKYKTNVVRFATKKIFGKSNYRDDIFAHPVWEEATAAFYKKFDKTSRSTLSEYIFTRATYLKHGFYNYPLAWNSDDRAWLDFSDGKPIFTINKSFVYFRLSDVNISGRKDNLEYKNDSEIEFYRFIVFEKLNYYNNEQKFHLLRRYQSEMTTRRSLRVSEFFTLLFFYLKYINVSWIKKFCKKVLNKILRKN
jgi:glycosyltransferase involved in cell wall biosynthesis